jgi:hypothetical protein
MSEDNAPLTRRPVVIQATEVIDYLDSELARAVIKCRQTARNMSKSELDKIVANFLVTTGIKLASNGGYTKDEIQGIVTSVLESI